MAICLIAADRLGVIDQFEDILSFESKNINFNIIKKYIKSKYKKTLDELISFPYYVKIKELLLS